MEKLKIKPKADRSEHIWAHLLPVIEFALEQGCTFKTTSIERPFMATKNGDECNLNGTLTMEELEAKFDFPESITFGGPHRSCLWDEEGNITICIYRE